MEADYLLLERFSSTDRRGMTVNLENVFPHLAIVLVHAVGHVQDPVHFHVVWVKRLLVLKRTTRVRGGRNRNVRRIKGKRCPYLATSIVQANELQITPTLAPSVPLTSWKMRLICACLVLNLLIFWWILLSFSSWFKLAHSQCRYELGDKRVTFYPFGCFTWKK